MRKNVAGQIVAFGMVSATDGSAVTTGTPTVYYTIDGGTQGTGAGTSTHEGNGQWTYAPSQAETNGNHVVYTMVITGAINQTVNVWPVSFDPTDAVRIGITALPNAAAGAAGGLPTDSTGKTSFNDIAATEVVSGGAITTSGGKVSNVGTVDTTTTNTDMRGTDGANTTAPDNASIAAILADTADMQPKLGAPSVDISSDIAAIKGDTGAILTDTGTTLPGVLGTPAGADMSTDIAAVKGDTAAILTDTADIQPKIGTPAADLSADIAAVKVQTAAIETDTQDIQTQIGTAGAGLTDLGGMSTGMKAEVNAEADTALADYDGPTNAEMEARTPTAAQLAYITANAATGLPVTFSGTGTTTTGTLALVDGTTPSAITDQYKGRLLVFNAGTLSSVVTDIAAYDGTTNEVTVTAVPTAIDSSHTARLI